MVRMLHTELWKALHNINFYIAIGAGLVIVVLNVGQNAVQVHQFTQMTLLGVEQGFLSGGHDGFSLFIMTLPYNGIGYAALLFQLVWPVLSAMPYAWSYSTECRNGLISQIVVRCGTSQYIMAKYIAVFVSGGLVVSMTVLIDLLVNALICPFAVIDVCYSLVPIYNDGFLPALYYTSPWIHALIWCVVVFFLGGASAGLVFLVGARLKLQVLVILVPFAILMVWNVLYYNVINAFWGEYLPSLSLSPLEMIRVVGGNGNPEWLVMLTIGLLSTIGFGSAVWQVKHHELV